MASADTDLELLRKLVHSFQVLANQRTKFNIDSISNVSYNKKKKNELLPKDEKRAQNIETNVRNDIETSVTNEKANIETEQEKQERFAKEEKQRKRQISKDRALKGRERVKQMALEQRQKALANAAKKNLIKELKMLPRKIPKAWQAHINPEDGKPYYIDTETGEWYTVNNAKKHKRIETNEKIHIVTMESILEQSKKEFENSERLNDDSKTDEKTEIINATEISNNEMHHEELELDFEDDDGFGVIASISRMKSDHFDSIPKKQTLKRQRSEEETIGQMRYIYDIDQDNNRVLVGRKPLSKITGTGYSLQ